MDDKLSPQEKEALVQAVIAFKRFWFASDAAAERAQLDKALSLIEQAFCDKPSR